MGTAVVNGFPPKEGGEEPGVVDDIGDVFTEACLSLPIVGDGPLLIPEAVTEQHIYTYLCDVNKIVLS